MNRVRIFMGFEKRLSAFSQTRVGRLAVAFVATTGWVLLWAGYDLAVVGVAFRPTDGSVPRIGVYWIATWWVLYPISTLLAFRTRAWLPILAVWIGGWEDVLFYWIQGIPVPDQTPWVLLTPTDDILYLRAGLFLLASSLAMILYHRRSTRAHAPPT